MAQINPEDMAKASAETTSRLIRGIFETVEGVNNLEAAAIALDKLAHDLESGGMSRQEITFTLTSLVIAIAFTL